jgi:hypothetical protein
MYCKSYELRYVVSTYTLALPTSVHGWMSGSVARPAQLGETAVLAPTLRQPRRRLGIRFPEEPYVFTAPEIERNAKNQPLYRRSCE